jgi:hypothetical protein
LQKPIFRRKQKHRLHECKASEDFIGMLETEAGSSSVWHPSRFIEKDTLEGLVLGGSIPLGIASPASDVDLIAIVREPGHVPVTFPSDENVIFSVTQEMGLNGTSANVVILSNHIEIDINFVSMPWLLATYSAACSGRSPPLSPEVRLLARLKRGWTLSENSTFKQFLESLRSSHTIEIRCSVSSYIFALKALEDATAALADNLPLALHLGRLCVERAMHSYFAALGETHIGDKWLRLARRGVERSSLATGSTLPARGERLMFPCLNLIDGEVEAYLRKVREFTSQVKLDIERNPAFRIAFRLCPQIEDPRMLGQLNERVEDDE